MNAQRETIPFPQLNHGKIPLAGVIVMGVVLATIFLYSSLYGQMPPKVLGGLLWLPLIVCLLENLWKSFARNRQLQRWVQSFNSHISVRELREMVAEDPQNFTLHVHQDGKTDWWQQATRLAVLTGKTEQQWAVAPTYVEAIEICEKLGVNINRV